MHHDSVSKGDITKVSESSAEPSPAGISEPRAVVHRHGTTLQQSVQRYRCRLYFSLFFNDFDSKVGKLPEDIVGKEAFHSCPLSCPCQIVDGYCVLYIAFKPILHIKHVPLKIYHR